VAALRGGTGGESGVEPARLGATGRGALRPVGPSTQHRARARAVEKKTPVMPSAVRSSASKQTAFEYSTGYEAMRNHVVDRCAPMFRHGLALLVHQGLASWMRACSKVSSSPRRPTKDEKSRPCPLPLPDEPSVKVVRVLAAMAMGHIQEVRA